MATTTATITINSTDLLTDELSLSTTATLTNAGGATGITQCSGLARTNFTNNPIQSKVIYRSDDATANGANKVYLKNLSSTASEYFTVFIDQEEMGRLYAGDWCLFPWSATSGTKETFIATIGGTWVAGETWEFDGVLVTAANSTVADIAAQIDAEEFPNWTTTRSGAAVTFVAREARDRGTVVIATADIVIVQSGGSDATSVVSSAAMGTATESDIIVVPSVVTTMDLEHMLLKE
jgi:hypothetical protein|tara:strand:+ start:195 stop:902 length:708 start_codon:yes stop_codon:yes gene_type:complete